MKKKIKKWIVLGVFVLACLAITILFFSHNEGRLNGNEREWITKNQNNVQNIAVVNDVNMIGNAGKGLYYSFLSDLQDEYGIKLNYITLGKTDTTSSLAMMVGNEMPEHAFSFLEDHYVLVSKSENYIHIRSDIAGKKIGVLSRNKDYISGYLSDISNVEVVPFEQDSELLSALDLDTVNYIVVPRREYLDTILKKYFISYHFSDLKRYYYVVDSNEGTLYQIIIKYYYNWKNKLNDNLHLEERSIFTTALNISNSDLDSLQNKALVYAYKQSLPFEVGSASSLGGIFGRYLDSFSSFSNIDFKYKQYHNDKDLERDVRANKISLMANYYGNVNAGTNVFTSIPVVASVIVHDSNPLLLDGLVSLKDKVVYVEENCSLATLISKYVKEIKTYKSSDLSKIVRNKESIIVLDEQKANYLIKHSYTDYRVAYQFNLKTNYALNSFVGEVFNRLMIKYFNYLDPKEMMVLGNYEARELEVKNSFFGSLARYALYAVVITLVILIFIIRSNRKVRLQKKVKKEDKLKFVDHLTSLKNRNYLNENLEVWNKNTIYPQAVVVIDLNRVQEINDTLGYEEGDKQIVSAASILIKTQLDNTDIIRTDGNEFMVYLVGYNTKQVTSYIHKLTKEFKSLPHDYGVCLSYSMIETDTKYIEDALNECVEDIKSQKEKLIKEEEK